MKKDGEAVARAEKRRANRSYRVFLFTAAITPRKIPINDANIMAEKAKTIVPGSASNNISETFLLL